MIIERPWVWLLLHPVTAVRLFWLRRQITRGTKVFAVIDGDLILADGKTVWRRG